MATKETCPFYDNCGYRQWRAERRSSQALPLPADGDCGIPLENCQRVATHIPIEIGHYGPATEREMTVAFPLIYNQNGRPPKRIEGGGHR